MTSENIEDVESTEKKSTNFIEDIINKDLESGKRSEVVVRFPPEPNGYLHIGHAKSICLNFGMAEKFKGRCHLRFDDTNPIKEDDEFIQSIEEDVKWLGFDWGEDLYFASNYFDKLYERAVFLIKKGVAYVDSLSAEEIRKYRGTLKEPGKDSPYRNRSVEENLELFEKMRAGEFEEGEHILRAKIDMESGNIVMRDPALYRIRKVHHQKTGDKWCIYPMYDFTHCLSDSIEGITHSICTLEFENNRPLYDWVVDLCEMPHHPQQIEFARLNLTYTVMSKRKLLELVQSDIVKGWDDPRMPTISGLRRRGYTASSIREFANRIGVAKANNMVEIAMLEHCIREELNQSADRRIAVLDPLKVIITNYPEGQVEEFDAVNNPEDESKGKRKIPFSRELYIERSDFMEDAPKKFFRLAPGKEVRFKFAYYITCNEVMKDDNGEIIELHCTYDPDSRGGWTEDGRKVKGTIHWLSIEHAVPAEVRLYRHLFTVENPDGVKDKDYKDLLDPDSLIINKKALVEPSLKDMKEQYRCQFERTGYFCVDKDSTSDTMVFNRTVALKDSWKKIEKNQG